jgi:hypothetical protein
MAQLYGRAGFMDLVLPPGRVAFLSGPGDRSTQRSPSMRLSRRAAAVLGSALPLTALMLASGVPAQAATAGWHVVFTHHYGSPNNSSGYLTVIAPGSKDAWAFGGTDLSGATPGVPVAERWNGTAWKSSALPGGLTNQILAASADSPNDIWAVTHLGGDILHWNGTAWSVAEQLTGSGQLTGVTALSPANVWVFGGGGFTGGLGTWHFDGSTWTQQTGSAVGIEEASALSPTSIWAVGSNATSPANIITHYNGTTWAHVKATALSSLQFSDILALSPSDIWASASAQGSAFKGVLVHRTSSGWTRISLPWQVSPESIASDGHGGLWVTAQDQTSRPWAVHVSATGHLSRTLFSSSGTPFGLAQVPGTRSLWAAGLSPTTPTGANATIWAYGTP